MQISPFCCPSSPFPLAPVIAHPHFFFLSTSVHRQTFDLGSLEVTSGWELGCYSHCSSYPPLWWLFPHTQCCKKFCAGTHSITSTPFTQLQFLVQMQHSYSHFIPVSPDNFLSYCNLLSVSLPPTIPPTSWTPHLALWIGSPWHFLEAHLSILSIPPLFHYALNWPEKALSTGKPTVLRQREDNRRWGKEHSTYKDKIKCQTPQSTQVS